MSKFYFISALVLVFIFFGSCNRTPEAISKANDFIESGKYEKAISSLNKIDDEELDDVWVDSASVLKNAAFEKLLRTNDWDRITVLIEDEGGNKKFKREMSKILLKVTKEYLSKGCMDTVIATYAKQEPFLLSNLDSSKIVEIPAIIIEKALLKTWVGKWDVRNHEIAFRKGNDGYEGYCTINSGRGWNKDKIMYKSKQYLRNLTWKLESRIFQGGGYFDSYEYFQQNGSMKLYTKDSIYLWYGTSGLDATFVSKKVEGPADSTKTRVIY